MRSETRQRLLDLSARFYERHGDSFDDSRARPWPGWEHVWDSLSAYLPADRPLRCLDAGCGNGRFGRFLQLRHPALLYVGVDLDAGLLDAARRGLADLPAVSLHRLDLMTEDLRRVVPAASQDLVTLFGVLHHVPDEAGRRRLLLDLASLVAPGGALVASIWRLDLDPNRLRRKTIAWHDWNASRPFDQRIDPSDLDPGDVLLGWRGDRATPRYCHFPTESEIERLADLGREMEIVDRHTADGPTGGDNLYLKWRRSRPSVLPSVLRSRPHV